MKAEWIVSGIGIWNLRNPSKKLATSKMESFLMFNSLQESAIVISFSESASIFCSHFLDFYWDLHSIHGARKVMLKVYKERTLVESLWTMKQNRRNSFVNCKCKTDECIWFCHEDQRRIQNPVKYLRLNSFVKIFKGWLIITILCGKMAALVLLCQHLLVQSQERKVQKNLKKLFKVKGTLMHTWKSTGIFVFT